MSVSNRFLLSYKSTNVNPGEQIRALEINLQDLTNQLNRAKIPITVGPNEPIPTGLIVGQPVIDWSSGTSILKVWDGNSLI